MIRCIVEIVSSLQSLSSVLLFPVVFPQTLVKHKTFKFWRPRRESQLKELSSVASAVSSSHRTYGWTLVNWFPASLHWDLVTGFWFRCWGCHRTRESFSLVVTWYLRSPAVSCMSGWGHFAAGLPVKSLSTTYWHHSWDYLISSCLLRLGLSSWSLAADIWRWR